MSAPGLGWKHTLCAPAPPLSRPPLCQDPHALVEDARVVTFTPVLARDVFCCAATHIVCSKVRGTIALNATALSLARQLHELSPLLLLPPRLPPVLPLRPQPRCPAQSPQKRLPKSVSRVLGPLARPHLGRLHARDPREMTELGIGIGRRDKTKGENSKVYIIIKMRCRFGIFIFVLCFLF